MKFVIVLSALICCTYAQSSTQAVATPFRDQLERRAAALDARVKTEIKRLEAEKRGHLAQLLQEEEKRLETLANDLKVVSVNDVVRLAVLEDQLITMEYRVENEINILQRERATQELLLSNARILREWTTEEIKRLEADTAHRQQAEMVARELRRAEQRLGEIAMDLVKAQDQMSIERYEVELRAIEVRLYEALRALHFNPSTGTPAPVTGSTRPGTTATGSSRPTPTGTSRPTPTGTASPAPSTARPSTARPVTTGAPATTKAF